MGHFGVMVELDQETVKAGAKVNVNKRWTSYLEARCNKAGPGSKPCRRPAIFVADPMTHRLSTGNHLLVSHRWHG
jgi:hypothetical protein